MLFNPPLIPHNYHEISARLARLRHITSCSILHRTHYLQQPRFIAIFISPIRISDEPKKKTRISIRVTVPDAYPLNSSHYLSEYTKIFTQQIQVPTYRPKEFRITSYFHGTAEKFNPLPIHKVFEENDTASYKPTQAWTGPCGSRRLRLPGFLEYRHMKVKVCQPYAPAAFAPSRYS